MASERTGGLRITGSRFELTVLSDSGRLVDISLELPPETSHVLQHLAVTHVDPATGRRRRGGRTLLERSLNAVGAAAERLEVLPGDPPRFVLALVSSAGCVRRVDLDLVDAAELVVTQQVPIIAIGWPDRDWDGALARMLE